MGKVKENCYYLKAHNWCTHKENRNTYQKVRCPYNDKTRGKCKQYREWLKKLKKSIRMAKNEN